MFILHFIKAQVCAAHIKDGNCSFYTQCVEPRFHCGTNGYPLAYTDRYCNLFTNRQRCFTNTVSF